MGGDFKHVIAATALACIVFAGACACTQQQPQERRSSERVELAANDILQSSDAGDPSSTAPHDAAPPVDEHQASEPDNPAKGTGPDNLPQAEFSLIEDYRTSFDHGPKDAPFQKYIVLHDTEGEGDAGSVVDYWDGSGAGVAAHFIVNKDGTVVQCVPLDRITHHAGYGDVGHNDLYGITEDGRDDMVGSVPIGDWAPDYGMNAWSIGIEMVHVGGSGNYPEEQLEAVDALIAYIDAYYGFESEIIDHKAWRSGNSDTSPEFAEYLTNYQDHRTHA